MKDYPVPPIFLRQKIDVSTMTTSREIIDGQQRLRAILDFYHNKCAWKKNHSGRNQSLFFKDLTDEEKIHFLNYTLFVNIISQEEDSTIFDMFARLNSNSVVVMQNIGDILSCLLSSLAMNCAPTLLSEAFLRNRPLYEWRTWNF